MNGYTSLSIASRTALLALSLLVCAAPGPSARAGWQKRAASQKDAAHYSCPMHPSVKAAKPGKCPQCGMSLRWVGEGGEPHAAVERTAASSQFEIPDVELLDQDGRKVRFYSDLVKGKVVAINFIFTTCTTICPPLGATFARVQKELGGRDVSLISISVDPVTDTPERMKAWGEKFHAGPGWTFVTGDKQHIDELLRALGAASANPAEHSPTVLIGNAAKGQWSRAYGLAKPSTLVKLINDAAEGNLGTNGKESAP